MHAEQQFLNFELVLKLNLLKESRGTVITEIGFFGDQKSEIHCRTKCKGSQALFLRNFGQPRLLPYTRKLATEDVAH